MMLDALDIPYSPDMGGKEALSALGWSRTHRHEAFERWQHYDGESVIVFMPDGCPPCEWLAEAHCVTDGKHPLSLNADEMRACIRRIEELEAGE